jgi:2-dehydropantoate 2-reductase
MSLANPVIAVIGAGAVGGYYGARLIQHGFNVHLHMRNDFAAVRKQGLQIQSRDGDFSLSPEQVKVYESPEQMPPADLVLVTLKTTANDQLEELIKPILKSDSAIVTLQNGLGNEDRLAELFGPDRILGGMAFVCINRTEPGKIVHLDHGRIHLGEFASPPGARTNRIAEIFNTGAVPCRVLDNLIVGRWDKLVWNVPFNGLGALLDLTTDKLIGSERGMALVRRIMREVIAAAAGAGINLKSEIIEEKIRYTHTMGAYQTSMQIDRQLKRPLEIEAILGNPLKLTHRRNVVTPAMEMIYNLLSLMGE